MSQQGESAPGLADGLRAYALATVIGIIPGALVFASVGSGLDTVIDRGGEPDLDLILEPAILGPLVGLAVLALLPVVYKRLKGHRRADESR